MATLKVCAVPIAGPVFDAPPARPARRPTGPSEVAPFLRTKVSMKLSGTLDAVQ
jgi:hypothetical protein